ncbi:MAG: FAD-binding oxidoreductase [Alistipes sp.]|nr:FAD-binding oxidoreductase [Alistipes sp.]
MDLYTGTPWWLLKNRLGEIGHPLGQDVRSFATVIGGGITGALVANELRRGGIECIVIDKRSAGTGSTAASTALLQYEIDVPLHKLTGLVGEYDAAEAYKSCLRSIDDLERTFREARVDCAFTRVPSLFYASSRHDKALINREYRIRKKHGLPADLLDRGEIYRRFGISSPAALLNYASARIDAYEAASGLLARNIRQGLPVYTHTEVTGIKKRGDAFFLRTACGHTIETHYVIVAAGFEAGPFMPSKLMRLTSTFAVISEPVSRENLWDGDALIWETAQPYLYIRTVDTGDGRARIIVGGEDEPYNSAAARKFLLPKKAETLEKKFRQLMPHVPFKTEFRWGGTFSTTRDGLPLIGPWGGEDNLLYALGYGGNGITFSMIAAQVIAGIISGDPDKRQELFSPARRSLRK